MTDFDLDECMNVLTGTLSTYMTNFQLSTFKLVSFKNRTQMHSPLKLNMSEIFDRITLPTKTPQKYMLGGLKGGGRGGGSTSGGGAVLFCFVGFFLFSTMRKK